MQPFLTYCPLILAVFVSLLTALALGFNHFIFHFSGNNYFPPETSSILLILFLIFLGSSLQFGKNNFFSQIIRELTIFFSVLAVVTFATNGVQYTPFSPIDSRLVALDNIFHINIAQVVDWTAKHPSFKKILIIAYNSLPYEMAYLPCIFIIFRQFSATREYYSLLLLSVIIGFSFYYFFPTIAPASSLKSANFLPEQYATGIKFAEIHQHKMPSTNDGGLIAFPSFHIIWAWLTLYMIRKMRIIFILLLPLNLLLAVSCVLLGWHYLLDIIGSVIVLCLIHGFYWYLNPQKEDRDKHSSLYKLDFDRSH